MFVVLWRGLIRNKGLISQKGREDREEGGGSKEEGGGRREEEDKTG